MEAANATNKLFTRYGSKPGPQPDLAALQRNMTEYDTYRGACGEFVAIDSSASTASAARCSLRATSR